MARDDWIRRNKNPALNAGVFLYWQQSKQLLHHHGVFLIRAKKNPVE